MTELNRSWAHQEIEALQQARDNLRRIEHYANSPISYSADERLNAIGGIANEGATVLERAFASELKGK